MSAADILLARIVDYAGLFPPAALDMDTAVRNFHRYLDGDDSPMLGAFIVPAGRLGEFAAAFETVCCSEREQPWTLSVVCAGDPAADAEAIAQFQEGAVFLASLEMKAADARSAVDVLQKMPGGRTRYVEFAPELAGEILPVLEAHGARAKLRMGGATPESIPTAEAVADFLVACAQAAVPWKATAGLHHAVRGMHALTGEPGSAQAKMHGFVNLFVAATLAWFGAAKSDVVQVSEEEDASAFRLDDDVLCWREHTLIADQIERARNEFAISFGSCSFTEPVDDIKAMGWR